MNWRALIGFVVGSEAVGMLGGLFTFPSITSWYATLIKPDFVPPNWIFGPVWTLLYALMGVAAYLVWQRRAEYPRAALVALWLFAFQLILNLLWSIIFFGMHSILGGFVDIVLLWLAVSSTIISFYLVSPVAALVMVPYLAWVSFALYLNYTLLILN